jgi:hypothetical protein
MLVTDPHTGARSYGVQVRAGATRFPWFPADGEGTGRTAESDDAAATEAVSP